MDDKTENAAEPAAAEEPPARDDLEIEEYTPERIAEFLLNNSVGPADYAAAREEVKALGLDPDQIPHEKPRGL